MELLERHIETTDVWKVLAGPTGSMYHPVRFDGMSTADVVYNDSQMATLEPRLPELFRILGKEGRQVSGDSVQATLKLWRNELVPLSENMFAGVGYPYYAKPSSFTARVRSWDGVSGADPVVVTSFMGCITAYTELGLMYVECCVNKELIASKTWLEETRPGWRDAVLLAGTFDMSDAQFADLLLFAPIGKISSSPALPGLDLA